MKTLAQHALSAGVGIALLSGCGGSQVPHGGGGSDAPLNVQTRVAPLCHADGSSALHIIYNFGASVRDGFSPEASLIDVNGKLYGTTASGGNFKSSGTVFSITPSGIEHVLHSFGFRRDGAHPRANLIDVNGTFYGTTYAGGAHGNGTVFSITPSGKERVLHSFDDSDGSMPQASLIKAYGNLYGTTSAGGSSSLGTVFRSDLAGSERVLYSFDGVSGQRPLAPLIDVKGTFYGTTVAGGAYYNQSGSGTVFSVDKVGNEQVLHSFSDATGSSDGISPDAPLINVKGTFYGTTTYGGSGSGVFFSITPDGTEKVLYSFENSGQPEGSLVDVNGTFYGTTYSGGTHFHGSIFSITTAGSEHLVHSFGECNQYGFSPDAGMIDVNGTLYGTTTSGGLHGGGTVFALQVGQGR
jgi:uncharacterized repeat protein (TIGR03803 family)